MSHISLTLSDAVKARMIRHYHNHVIKSADTHIIRTGRDLCDVFTGQGWNNRTRYRLSGGRWLLISGPKLSALITSLLPNVR